MGVSTPQDGDDTLSLGLRQPGARAMYPESTGQKSCQWAVAILVVAPGQGRSWWSPIGINLTVKATLPCRAPYGGLAGEGGRRPGGGPPRLCRAGRLAPTLALPRCAPVRAQRRCARTGLAGEGLRRPKREQLPGLLNLMHMGRLWWSPQGRGDSGGRPRVGAILVVAPGRWRSWWSPQGGGDPGGRPRVGATLVVAPG
jgi:hypothetical protein